jgi:hypothetical protein
VLSWKDDKYVKFVHNKHNISGGKVVLQTFPPGSGDIYDAMDRSSIKLVSKAILRKCSKYSQ